MPDSAVKNRFKNNQTRLTLKSKKELDSVLIKKYEILVIFQYFRANWQRSVADPENFGGGGFEAQNLKNSDVFTKIETDFSAEIGNSNVFFTQIQVVSKKKKKKKKKKVFTKIETDFSPDWLRLGRWGRDASRNGADLFETEADFSAKIVTFRLVGGDASPPSPPLNPPLATITRFWSVVVFFVGNWENFWRQFKLKKNRFSLRKGIQVEKILLGFLSKIFDWSEDQFHQMRAFYNLPFWRYGS